MKKQNIGVGRESGKANPTPPTKEELKVMKLFNSLFQKMQLKELSIMNKIKFEMDKETNNYIALNFEDPIKMIHDEKLDKIITKYGELLVKTQTVLNEFKLGLQKKFKESLEDAKKNKTKAN